MREEEEREKREEEEVSRSLKLKSQYRAGDAGILILERCSGAVAGAGWQKRRKREGADAVCGLAQRGRSVRRRPTELGAREVMFLLCGRSCLGSWFPGCAEAARRASGGEERGGDASWRPLSRRGMASPGNDLLAR